MERQKESGRYPVYLLRICESPRAVEGVQETFGLAETTWTRTRVAGHLAGRDSPSLLSAFYVRMNCGERKERSGAVFGWA
jgi:hypothetical protein